MLFAKDDQYELPLPKEAKFTGSKVFISALSLAIGLTLVFAGFETVAPFVLLLLGVCWNFFCDFNSWVAFVFGFCNSFLFAIFAYQTGLYMSGNLYVLFYIPLQFIVCLTMKHKKNFIINKDKTMSITKEFEVFGISVFAFVLFGMAGSTMEGQLYPWLDSLCAVMLGLSAYLQSYSYKEYFFVRIMALTLNIGLWIVVGVNYGFGLGMLSIILMYITYLIYAIVQFVEWYRTFYVKHEPSDSGEEFDKETRKIIDKKVEEYNKVNRK